MTSHVVATAGHVDHGKSTLVRILTGVEPDRWAEEQRRGLTIDLGFAWTDLPSGREVAFVDVPGHERFIANMLAGLGPAPVVIFVVAADGGWSAQSSEHRDAIAALGIQHGLVVITRIDSPTADVDATITQTRSALANTGLAHAPLVCVSALTGAGMDALRTTLDEVLSATPAPDPDSPLRLWVDRSFSVAGAGTVVTATLASDTLTVGDRLQLGERTVTVRGLQRHGSAVETVGPISRIAVNLRGVRANEVERGDVLLTPGAWHRAATIDVRLTARLPQQVTVHFGTAAVPAKLRPFDDEHARLTLARPLPLRRGDRLVLREPGSRAITGAEVLDADPPALKRRGDGARRADVLARGNVVEEVARRRAVRPADLGRLGWPDDLPPGVMDLSGWWVCAEQFTEWRASLVKAVTALHATEPLAAGFPTQAAEGLLGVDQEALVRQVAHAAGLQCEDGVIRAPGHATLGSAESGIATVEDRLRASPFAAPEAEELSDLGLGPRELAAAQRTGRLLRLAEGIVVLPTAPALAMRTLAELGQPFTTSEARQALHTTRRVAIPLLEYLDARGWTRRIDEQLREVVH